MTKEERQAVIKDYATGEKDVGSVEVQVALLTSRITELTEHLKVHAKDNSSRRGLTALVNRRRKLLAYLDRRSHDRYVSLIRRLKLRR
ncbi:MAG: 30S ribosomal protein S15 [Lentisphaeria bacterium]|nr:30S ribosomal protein S15 [Lentisphaeria bacterium]